MQTAEWAGNRGVRGSRLEVARADDAAWVGEHERWLRASHLLNSWDIGVALLYLLLVPPVWKLLANFEMPLPLYLWAWAGALPAVLVAYRRGYRTGAQSGCSLTARCYANAERDRERFAALEDRGEPAAESGDAAN